MNNVGIIWFKIKKAFTCSDDDQYVTLCYIPPDNSTLNTNNNSNLHEFDFFRTCLRIYVTLINLVKCVSLAT